MLKIIRTNTFLRDYKINIEMNTENISYDNDFLKSKVKEKVI